MSLLTVSDLHVWFDLPNGGQLHAVRGIDFSVDEGERFGLVGESGCGKTTAILALMGLLPPNASVAGEVLLDGENVLARGEESAAPRRWREIAMIFQGAMNAFNPVKTVGSQIVEPMELHEVAEGKDAMRRARELLDVVGIPGDRVTRYPHEFSGGMRQRAAIAMALACKPKVLLADEPTTALDVMVQAQILELLISLANDFGLAVGGSSPISARIVVVLPHPDSPTSPNRSPVSTEKDTSRTAWSSPAPRSNHTWRFSTWRSGVTRSGPIRRAGASGTGAPRDAPRRAAG